MKISRVTGSVIGCPPRPRFAAAIVEQPAGLAMQTLPRFPDQARDDAASDIEPDDQERADEAQRRDGEKDVPTEFLHAPRVGVGAVDLAARGGDQPVGGFAEKRIGVGPKVSTGGTYFPEIFKALGIPAVIRNGPWAEIVQQVASGELGGTAVALGPPLVDLAALDVKDPLDFLQPSREQFALIKARFPDHPELVRIHPAAKETLAANLDRDTFLPLHPGAARYYREVGIAIPPAIAPAP